MTTGNSTDGPDALPGDHQLTASEHARLATGAVGLVGVLFMAVANAAPITAMTFNVPIAVGYGNGIGVSGGFLFATIVLTIFAVGYVAMAKHITTTGAFYGFISQGLGQVPGMVMGLLATFCYVIFEASLLGGFAYFADQYVLQPLGITGISWIWLAVGGAIVLGILGYFKITIAAGVLGVTLILEVVLLLALALSVVFKGGPDGFMAAETINPAAAFVSLPENAFGSGVAAGAAAIGIFFAFWSWVGFETTAVYGEESKNPKKVVPRATMIAVIGLGLFYSFLSWMVVVGNGKAQSVDLSVNDPAQLWLGLTEANLGGFAVAAYKFLVVIGSFACAMAFQNAAPRYIYALGRESASPFLRRTIGAAHPKHGSPANAAILQAVITVVILMYFYLFVTMTDADGNATPELVPYVYVYGLLAVVGTAVILILQTVVSFAVISYFWVRKVHKGNIITTLLCPIIGALGMLYVLVLLWQNREFALGAAATSWIWTWAPFYILAMAIIGIVYALWVKSKKPEIYAEIGRTVLEEAHERV